MYPIALKKTFPDLYPEERDVNALKLVKSVCNRTCLLTVSWRFIDSLKQSPYDMDVSSVEIISGRGGVNNQNCLFFNVICPL